MMNKRYIDWTTQQCTSLRDFCIAQWAEITPVGVYGAGSRAMGFQKTDGTSDLDVIIFLENAKQSKAWKEKTNKKPFYMDTKTDIALYDITKKWVIMRDRKSYLPLVNLSTGLLEWNSGYTSEEHASFVNAWLDFKIDEGLTNGYDFSEGRDFSDLIVPRET